MTLAPDEDRRSEGIDGPAYETNLICPVPGCDASRALERHHLWRRSDIGGDKWWVKTSDGKIHGNCVKFCSFHHRELTDNIAKITYVDGEFFWHDILSPIQLLLWQPPQLDAYLDHERPEESDDDADLRLVEKLGAAHVLAPGHQPDVCPTCLRKLPQPKSEKPEEKKVRKTWSVAVPLDQWEDGAQVIDTLLDEAHVELNRLGLPFGEGRIVKYYILAAALGMFVTHAESLMSDG
jgi:hypothetical protein